MQPRSHAFALLLLSLPALGCAGGGPVQGSAEGVPVAGVGATAQAAARGPAAAGPAEEQPIPAASEETWRMARMTLVDQLEREGIEDLEVLRALRTVPRHRFVPPDFREASYGNHPLPIGKGQTISQPYIVAYMTEAAALDRTENVLEVGTGSGYQAAVLAEVLGLGPDAAPGASHGRLCSIEIIPELAARAKESLENLGYGAIALRVGDGYQGWPERAPFDAILVTAAPGHVPAPLKEQLAVDGRLVIPVGDHYQDLVVITRQADGGFSVERRIPVRFVPMTGEAADRDG